MLLISFNIGGLAPVLPVVSLPGEVYPGTKDFLGGAGFLNTFMGTILAWLFVFIIILVSRARSRSADEVPSGFYNFIEMVVEMLYSFVESSSGKWTKTFFPWFMTIVMVVLVANWIELIPGVDSIGIWENLPHFKAEKEIKALEVAGEFEGMSEEQIEERLHEIEHDIDEDNVGDLQNGILLVRGESGPEEDGGNPDADWTIVPFVRAAATDLNFTLALAIISVVMTQFYGFKANGFGYLGKFFTFNGDKIAQNPLGLMDTLVGVLEFISEISKILSFAFRLFGNIFAGQVLLFVIGFLFGAANLAVFGLEFFVGAIQAAVFAMLTLTFMNQAVQEPHH
ncbi:MAG: F0F1 ATP synthase subunit A [Anaerolineales bacterium]|nr:F0F1 ATP synthase subunit A [Anaerolineales bacterium]